MFKLNLHDKEIAVDFERQSDDTFRITIEDRVYDIHAHRLSANHLYTVINGTSQHFYTHQDKGQKEVSVQGRSYTLEDATQGKRKRRSGDGEAGASLNPPMPGIVIRVVANEGDQVSKKQEMLVMSAMKMETTLRAPFDAIVKKVLVAEGDQIMPGQQLFELEKVEAEGQADA